MPPQRVRITAEQNSLQAGLQQTVADLSLFLNYLGAKWFTIEARERLTAQTKNMIRELRLPEYLSQPLFASGTLDRCTNQLDWFCAVSKAFNHGNIQNQSNHLIKIANAIKNGGNL
jgi:hypothetical protein